MNYRIVEITLKEFVEVPYSETQIFTVSKQIAKHDLDRRTEFHAGEALMDTLRQLDEQLDLEIRKAQT